MISPPEQRGCPTAVLKIAVVHDGCSHPRDVLRRMQCFRTSQMRKRILRAPILLRLYSESRGPRVDLAGINVPAKFIRLASVEARCFNPTQLVSQPDGP